MSAIPPWRDPAVIEILNDLFLMPAEYSNELTLGSWLTEKESAEEFDRRLEEAGCFRVHREVPGQYLQPRPGTSERTCRIDRILLPAAKLLAAGWPHGPIGIEIEASRRKVGAAICQCLDYTRAIWKLQPGFLVNLEWLAIWPWLGSRGNLAQIACQNRICGVYYGHHRRLVFSDGSTNGLVCAYDGAITAKGFKSGNKTGHRAGV